MCAFRMLARLLLLILLLDYVTLCVTSDRNIDDQFYDNEFAEFEDAEESSFPASKPDEVKPSVEVSNDEENIDPTEEATVEDEPDEFDVFEDDSTEFSSQKKEADVPPKANLKIARVASVGRLRWESFYLEIILITGICVYLLNFVHGRYRNQEFSDVWLAAHLPLLNDNFSLVGDNGLSREEESSHKMMKESESNYKIWCSGRVACKSLSCELKLLKRHDLVSIISYMMKPSFDQIIYTVQMSADEMDSFVMALGTKRSLMRLQKEMLDLSQFCGDRKSADKIGLTQPGLQLLSEVRDTASSLLDAKSISLLNRYGSAMEYLHFSDQYSSPRNPNEDSSTQPPVTEKCLVFCFNVPGGLWAKATVMESLVELLQYVLYTVDKVKRTKLGKEAKVKTDQNRAKVELQYQKLAHSIRQEKAMLRKEDKLRKEKEDIMNTQDPEVQRRWEAQRERREAKRRQSKSKVVKVKGM